MPEITLADMKILLNEQTDDILREMHSKFTEIKLDMRKVTEIAEKADALASAKLKKILQFQASVGELKEANISLKC